MKKSKDGGYRTIAPEETYKKHAHLVSHISGIVGSLEHRQSGTIHAYRGGYNHVSLDKNIYCESFRGYCMGKGKSKAQAKTSCLCEGLERYSNVFQGCELRKKASFNDLKEMAIHPQNFLLYSQKQYQEREKYPHIPQPFSEDVEIEWSPIWSMTHQTMKYLPTALCYYSYPESQNTFHFIADSNGCAAGNTYEEAILQGLLEIVERDSVAIWWYNQIDRPRVDLDSFSNPYIQECISEYAKMQRELWVLDLTGDLGIPVFFAFSKNRDSSHEELIWGEGCHIDATIAVERAITEVHQATLFLPEWRERAQRNLGDFSRWFTEATIEKYPFIKGSTLLKTALDYPHVEKSDLLEMITSVRNRIEDKGMEMLLLDQTRIEVGLRVVKVIVPGMRHFLPRFAPGRLYDVPVQLGWLEKPRKDHELNNLCPFE